LVTRAKYAISFFRPVQGRVPPRPMPILFVAATIRVNSRGIGGIFGSFEVIVGGFKENCEVIGREILGLLKMMLSCVG
jgi:hypothetical protein